VGNDAFMGIVVIVCSSTHSRQTVLYREEIRIMYRFGNTDEITDEMVAVFQKAWHATPKGEPGDRTRAGLDAALHATWGCPHVPGGCDVCEFGITDEMVAAFQKAWHATPKGEPGDRTRAGLDAALHATWGCPPGASVFGMRGTGTTLRTRKPVRWAPILVLRVGARCLRINGH
jgi:hypothetical protein